MRVLIVVTHLLGVGHLTRAAALGRAFAGAGHVVRLVSGGRVAPTVDFTGVEVVQLPPVHVEGTKFSTLLTPDGNVAGADYQAARQAQLLESARQFAPDVAIIELFPFGRRQLRAEFLHLLEALSTPPFSTLILSSIRDVLNPPSTPAKAAQTARWLGFFDGVLCHADAGVMPLEESWPVDAALARRVHYTGYVGAPEGVTGVERAGILVSGGGSAASLPLLRVALVAAGRDGRPWRLLVGHGVAEDDFQALCAASPANAIVERARPDFPALLAGAACSVSQFGYNTALDLAVARTPAVVVPFDAGAEVEQTIRARRFAERGLVVTLPAADATPEAMLAAIEQAMANGAPAVPLDIGGAERSVTIAATLLAQKRHEAEGWQRLAAALNRAVAAGRHLRFWWRDDDVVAPGAALDSLLALRHRHKVPLVLAAIPEAVEASLAMRLAEEDDVAVMIHGISHRDNASAGRKKQELVAANGATLEGLARGRERFAALFGPRAVPVLAPPWNRVAPEVVAALGDCGIAGWSGYDGGLGLAQDGQRWDTHLDVIDWRGGGGLAAPDILLARLASLIDAQRPGDAAIGVLTHHLVHDAATDIFMDRILSALRACEATRFLRAEEVFGLTGRISEGRQA